ncbi:MAG: GT-D fold domain-containing glycosyltransferase [Syntrophomonas sp.]
MQVAAGINVDINKVKNLNINPLQITRQALINNCSKNPAVVAEHNKVLKIGPARSMLNAHSFANSLPLLNSAQLMDKILLSLEKQQPLSVISLGATEAFVMAQYTIYSEEEFMNHPEAKVANQGKQSGFLHRGIRFPNVKARDEAVEAVRNADLVGCNTLVEPAWALTAKVLQTYNLQPQYMFEANLRRVLMFSQKEKFAAMMAGRKILLIGSQAPLAKKVLEAESKNKLGFDIVGAISIFEYEEINRVKHEIEQYQFDLCLLAAGTNALILAPYIAASCGKVAFDIGWGIQSLITGEIVMDQWLTYIIGIDRIMHM